jgi:hypothetical protein
MSELLTLYRGDYEKIDEFDFRKTKKHCLVGPGIYLTTARKVAETYRIKGSRHAYDYPRTLFNGLAKDRPDALGKAYEAYFRGWCQLNGHLPHLRASGRKKPEIEAMQRKLHAEATRSFNELVETKVIRSEYQQTYRAPGAPPTIIVTIDWGISVGYITEFSFPRHEFEASVVNIDGQIKDAQFWELMFDAKINIGTPYDLRHDYITRNMWESNRNLAGLDFAGIRRIVVPYGYRGFEYRGGGYTGSVGTHRAFCVWEDDYVNQHKVRRLR